MVFAINYDRQIHFANYGNNDAGIKQKTYLLAFMCLYAIKSSVNTIAAKISIPLTN